MTTDKIALILRGGISNTRGKLSIDKNIDNKDYVNFKCVKNSLYKHLILNNKNYNFDFYVHSWNLDLKQDLIELYNPKNSSFENNELYINDIKDKLSKCNASLEFYNQASQALAIKKSFELIKDSLYDYKYIIFYRPDVLLWKNLDLSRYDIDNIYCNNYGDGQGDFHFVMSSRNAEKFSLVYDYLCEDNPPIDHIYIPKYSEKSMGKKILCDNIEAGVHQEVVRKLQNSLDCGYLSAKDLFNYDISVNEIESYTF
jgi:hypothetical protein